MIRSHFILLVALTGVLLALGCKSGYSWRPRVPAAMRTVAVPTFRNESETTELGAVVTRQILREFQREGTFEICRAGDAALEVQGVVRHANMSSKAYSRKAGLRVTARDFSVKALVSVVDKHTGRVLVNNRVYEASVPVTVGDDLDAARRDASGRLADELARQVVDDVLNLKW